MPPAGSAQKRPRENRGASDARHRDGSVLTLSWSVLGDQRLRCVVAPDFEAHAAPDVEPANRVLTFDGVVEPHLDGDRAEIVADQAALAGGREFFCGTTPWKVYDFDDNNKNLFDLSMDYENPPLISQSVTNPPLTLMPEGRTRFVLQGIRTIATRGAPSCRRVISSRRSCRWGNRLSKRVITPVAESRQPMTRSTSRVRYIRKTNERSDRARQNEEWRRCSR